MFNATTQLLDLFAKFIRSTARSTVDTMLHIFEKHLIAICQSIAPFARRNVRQIFCNSALPSSTTIQLNSSQILQIKLQAEFLAQFAANLKPRQFLIGFVFWIF